MPEVEVTESFIDTLPEEIKEQLTPEDIADVNVNKYKTFPEFIKGHRNLAPMIAAKGVIIPKDDAPPEEFDKFYNSLGRPEKADGYKLSEIKGLHPSIKITPEGAKEFFDFAHKTGLTGKQVDALNQWYMGKMNGLITASEKARVEKEEADTKAWNDKVVAGETTLKNEWQNDYDKNVALARAAIKKLGDKNILDELGEAATKPAVLKLFAKVGATFSEDEIKNLGLPGGSGGENADVIKKIKEIQDAPRTGKEAHPYWNERDPKHDEAVAEYTRLYQLAYGESSAA